MSAVRVLLVLVLATVVGTGCGTTAAPLASATENAPSPTATVSARTATPTSFPASYASAEQLADALASALGQSDYSRLANLITPTGWVAGVYQSEGTKPMTRQETIDWLRSRARNGTLEVVVQPRPVLPHASAQPPGDTYIRSTWSNFGTVSNQNVDLMLRAEGGTWYWSGALFNAPVR